MNNSKIKIIVTGGCGFIGSHIVDKLINLSYDVHVIDDCSAEENESFYFN
jgi:UDP-glucose 4-epimerase